MYMARHVEFDELLFLFKYVSSLSKDLPVRMPPAPWIHVTYQLPNSLMTSGTVSFPNSTTSSTPIPSQPHQALSSSISSESITSSKSYPATSVFDHTGINLFVDLSSQQPISNESYSSSTPKRTHSIQLRASTLTRKPTTHLVTSTNVEIPFEPTSYAQAHKQPEW